MYVTTIVYCFRRPFVESIQCEQSFSLIQPFPDYGFFSQFDKGIEHYTTIPVIFAIVASGAIVSFKFD